MPLYPLDRVKTAAKLQSVEYAGRPVFRDTANLGYSMVDVCSLIQCLAPEDFNKSHTYPDSIHSHDSYICSYPRPNSEDDEIDEIFIKVALIGDQLEIVEVGSFHPPRY